MKVKEIQRFVCRVFQNYLKVAEIAMETRFSSNKNSRSFYYMKFVEPKWERFGKAVEDADVLQGIKNTLRKLCNTKNANL